MHCSLIYWVDLFLLFFSHLRVLIMKEIFSIDRVLQILRDASRYETRLKFSKMSTASSSPQGSHIIMHLFMTFPNGFDQY